MRRGPPGLNGLSTVCALQAGADGPSCLLLLGDASNALAIAAAGRAPIAPPGAAAHTEVCVSHIVCVADARPAREIQRAIEGSTTRAPRLAVCAMSDWKRPDECVVIHEELAEPLAAVAASVRATPPPDMPATAERGVLVHCTRGHNRSPALVLAALVQLGCSLRDAYRLLMRARPDCDPLPAYRAGLRAFELALRGGSTVSPDELFAMHISQLMQLSRNGALPSEASDEYFGDDADPLEVALDARDSAVDALLAERRLPPLSGSAPTIVVSGEYLRLGAQSGPGQHQPGI